MKSHPEKPKSSAGLKMTNHTVAEHSEMPPLVQVQPAVLEEKYRLDLKVARAKADQLILEHKEEVKTIRVRFSQKNANPLKTSRS
jgi:hypothetical protein